MDVRITKKDLHAFCFSDELKDVIVNTCSVVQQKRGEIAMHQGDNVTRIPLYLSGESILSHYSAEKDKTYTICHVSEGDTCPTSLSSILTNQPSPVTGIAVHNAIKVIVPAHDVLAWQNTHPTWSKFIIKSLAHGYTSILDKFHQTMLGTVEERIVEFLSNSDFNSSNSVKMTHKEVAEEVGSTRVVVSRVLKNLEKSGILVLKRGEIVLNTVHPDLG